MLRGLASESGSEDELLADSHVYGGGGKTDRKKRRGVIEKKRRDRINGSLSELKRLVPQAFEKQGSTKLEKAEILQMTVEHIRLLNSKGMNGLCSDPGTLAMDYRSVGFRECVAEVARYLSAVEGLDFNDPMRLRLLGHLEAYNSQRDASAKANLQGLGSWNAWSSFHGNTASMSHSKLSYGLSSKAGLNQLGLIGTASQSGHIDGAYLAASRLGSTIGLGNHMTSMTSSGLTQLPQSGQPGSGHYAVTHPQGVGGKLTSSSQYGHGLHPHAHIKHIGDIKHLGSEFAY